MAPTRERTTTPSVPGPISRLNSGMGIARSRAVRPQRAKYPKYPDSDSDSSMFNLVLTPPVSGSGGRTSTSPVVARGRDTSSIRGLLEMETHTRLLTIPGFFERFRATAVEDDVAAFAIVAGETIGIKTTWEFCIQRIKPERRQDRVGVYIRLRKVENNGRGRGARARVSTSLQISFKNSRGELCAEDMPPDLALSEWTPSSDIEDFRGLTYTLQELMDKGFVRDGAGPAEGTLDLQLQMVVYGDRVPVNPNDQQGGGAGVAVVSKEEHSFKKAKQAWGEVLLANFQSTFKDGLNYDVKLAVKKNLEETEKNFTIIRAHKAILSAGSSRFKGLLDDSIPYERDVKGGIILEGYDEATIRILLGFLYTGELDKNWGSVGIKLRAAAEAFDLPPLKQFIDENFDKVVVDVNCEQGTAAAIEIIKTVKDNGDVELAKEMGIKLKKSFNNSIDAIFG